MPTRHISIAAQDSVAATLRLWLLDVEADCKGSRLPIEMSDMLIQGTLLHHKNPDDNFEA